jgi:hypothetical protein
MPEQLSPLSQEEYDDLIRGLVCDCAPRLFAVVRDYGERIDGEIVAWGMAFDGDWAEAVTIPGRMRISVDSLDGVVRRFAGGEDVTARVVWARPEQERDGGPGAQKTAA